ncbi:MAG: hypothetical protein F4W92_09540 [Gammaproteobacteria bacterium]|nr:hypothetical protein [Gammaproteobacteria bacterium]
MAEVRNKNFSMIEQLIAVSNVSLVRRAIGAQILASIGLILLLKAVFLVSWTWCGLICGILLVWLVLQVIYYQHKKNAILSKVPDQRTTSTSTVVD